MTAKLGFTQASVRRAIAAARKEGLNVVEIKPDGTLVIGHQGTAGDVVVALFRCSQG